MTCEDFQAAQLEKWQGTSSPEIDREASEHLSSCPSCREGLPDVASIRSLLHQNPDTHEPSAALWARIEAGIGATTPARFAGTPPAPQRGAWWVLKAAAAIIVAAALFAAWQSTDRRERDLPRTAAIVLDALGAGVPVRGARLDAGGAPLRLGEGDSAILDLPDAGRVKLRGPVEVSFDAPLAWRLHHGELTADIAPGGYGFRVVTPCAEVSVTGTVFRVNASETGTALTVGRGSVRMKNAHGAQSVPEKTRSMALRDVAPSAPTPVADPSTANLGVEETLRRDPHLSIEASDDLTLRFRFTSPHAKLLLSPPGASPSPYYILNALDEEGNAFSVRLNDLGGQGTRPESVEGKAELVQEFKVRSVLPHAGRYLLTGLYVGPGGAEWEGILESAPVLIEAK